MSLPRVPPLWTAPCFWHGLWFFLYPLINVEHSKSTGSTSAVLVTNAWTIDRTTAHLDSILPTCPQIYCPPCLLYGSISDIVIEPIVDGSTCEPHQPKIEPFHSLDFASAAARASPSQCRKHRIQTRLPLLNRDTTPESQTQRSTTDLPISGANNHTAPPAFENYTTHVSNNGMDCVRSRPIVNTQSPRIWY